MAKRWIAEATKGAHGQFRRKAEKAGMSTAGYARKVLKKGSKASTKTKRQAVLAQNLAKARRGRK